MRNVFFVKKVKGLLQNVVSMGVSRDITSNVQEEFNAKCSFLSNLIINKISIFVFVYYTLKAKVWGNGSHGKMNWNLSILFF